MIVYAVTNIVTGKRYIGITSMSVEKRWYHHLWRCQRGTKTVLYSAIRKYGESAFEIAPVLSLIPSYPIDDLCDLEQEMIAQDETMCPRGYNMTAGGDGTIGLVYTPQRRAAISARSREVWSRPETRHRASEAQKRRPPKSPETIAKTVATRRAGVGYRNPQPKMRGRVLSAEHRAKMRAAWSDERRAAQATRMSALRRRAIAR